MVKDQLYGLKLKWTMNCPSLGQRPDLTEIIRCMAELVFSSCVPRWVCFFPTKTWALNISYERLTRNVSRLIFFLRWTVYFISLAGTKPFFWMSFTRTTASLKTCYVPSLQTCYAYTDSS